MVSLQQEHVFPFRYGDQETDDLRVFYASVDIISEEDIKLILLYPALSIQILLQAAPKNKYWKFQFSSRDILAVALFHQEYPCQKSFPHSLAAKVPLSIKCGYLFKRHLPFDHHLLYNCLVIQDTPLCIL